MAPERMAVITSCVFPPMPSLWHQLGTSGGHTVQMEGQLGSPRSPWTEMKQTVGAGLEWKNVARPLMEGLYPASPCRPRKSCRCSLMSGVPSWYRTSARAVWPSSGSKTRPERESPAVQAAPGTFPPGFGEGRWLPVEAARAQS